MAYIPFIKDGIRTVHKNWQLVFVHLVSLILSCMSFFIIVGIPIAIAFIMFGLDLTEILRLKDIVSAFKGSAELLNKYFGMALVVLLSLFVYLTCILVLWIFTLGGTIGILSKSITNQIERFSLSAFFAEGKAFFVSVFAFSSIIGIIFIVLAFILGLMGGGASAIIETAKGYEATLGLFLGVFFSLAILSIGFLLILLTLSATVYGAAHLAFTRSRAWDALKESVRYLYAHPSSLCFYGVLLLGYMLIGFVVIVIGSPLALIPLIGPILSMPYQLVSYIIQGYVSLIMLASAFQYYYKTRLSPTPPQSIAGPDTSPAEAPEQGPVPEGTEEHQQG